MEVQMVEELLEEVLEERKDPSDSSTTPNEAEMSKEENEEHPFMTVLPETVREEIFNKLPQKDALRLRLVCQQWRDEIDRSFDYRIGFGVPARSFSRCGRTMRINVHTLLPWPTAVQEELSRRTERLLQFRVKDCVLHYIKIEFPFLTLKYPKIMRSLEINVRDEWEWDLKMNEHNEWEWDRLRCPLEHYDQLLKTCAKYLRKLSISRIPLPMLTNEGLSYDLQALKTLKIKHVCIFNNVVSDSMAMRRLNQDQYFNNFITSSLKSLNVFVNSFSLLPQPQGFFSYTFANGIIKLIGSNWKTLEQLELVLLEDILPTAVGYQPESKITPVNWTHLQKVRGLKKVFLAVNWSQLQSGLRQLLENQEGLEDIHLRMPLYNPEAIRSNYRTLVSVEIEPQERYPGEIVNQGLGPGGLYDLSDFRNCQNLKQLILYNDGNEPRQGPSYPKLVNFHLLPKSLETLEIFQFLVSSNEMNAFFADCTNLENLVIASGKSTDGDGEFGVNYDGLAAILSGSKPNLKRLAVTEFNIEGTKELDRIVSRLNGSGIHGENYHDIMTILISSERESNEDAWTKWHWRRVKKNIIRLD